MDFIREKLFALKDEAYGDFISKLVPTVPRERIIGCRTPEIKKLEKCIAKDLRAAAFLDALPHHYYEENNLHGFLIGALHKDITAVLNRVERFLPYIDNWAACDGTVASLKILAKYPVEVKERINVWLGSGKTYTVRFAAVSLMSCFLDKNFEYGDVEKLCALGGGDYYIDMAVAWYFSTALAKRYEDIIRVFEAKRLPKWTHNKAIQKACESYRVSDEKKAYLKTLKQ